MATMVLKAGGRYKSAVSEVQVMVIKAPPGEHGLQCAGRDMLAAAAAAPEATSDEVHGETLIGKRYVNDDESLELLCTKGGRGELSCDGALLAVKQAKQLPSSD